jgi:hypothetical protein
MSDDNQGAGRTRRIIDRVDAVHDTFVVAGIDPANPASREEFAEAHRWARRMLQREISTRQWRITTMTTIAAGVITGLLLTFGPVLVRHLLALVAK